MSICFKLFFLLVCLTLLSFGQNNLPVQTVEERTKLVEQNVPAGVVEIAGKPKESILDRMKYYNVQGLSIAVINDFKVEWAKGYGWADTNEKRPVTKETIFQIGSISKSLNSVGVLKLAQDKKINLDKDINDYLTSWKFPYDAKSNGKKITFAQLLSHTAGLNSGGSDYAKGDSLPTIYEILDGKRPATSPAVRSQFEPGSRFQYSNGGATITQLIISDITKKKYEDYMKKTVLRPLKMTSSFYNEIVPENFKNKFATGYEQSGEEVDGKYHLITQQAGGSVWSTPSDLCNFIIEMQLSYKGKSNKVLSEEMTKKMMSPQLNGAGLGVFIDSIGSERYFKHDGSRRGFTSLYYASLETGKGVVIFINSSNNPTILNEIVNSVAVAYDWKDFYKPIVKNLIPITRKELEEYDGEYVWNSSVSALVSGQDDRLQILITGQNRFDVFPESKDNFFAQIANIELEFVRTNNAISKMVYKVGGRSFELTKK